MWNSQGQWRPSWKCHNMWHIRKMLLLLLWNSVQSLTVLIFCAQWMVLAALLLIDVISQLVTLFLNGSDQSRYSSFGIHSHIDLVAPIASTGKTDYSWNLFYRSQIVTVFVCTDNITLGYCTRWILPEGPCHVEKRHVGGLVPLLKGHMGRNMATLMSAQKSTC